MSQEESSWIGVAADAIRWAILIGCVSSVGMLWTFVIVAEWGCW